MNRRGTVWSLIGLVLLASACSSAAEDYSGFATSEECLRAMPIVRPDIEADALADRCGVSQGMAEIALVAASVENPDSDSDSGSSATGTDGGDPGQGASNSTTTTSQTTTTQTTTPPTTTSTTMVTTTLLPGGIVVPDVVGLDHQEAQDTMQAVGLRNLSEEDATGEGRRLLWDRNWIVIAQVPAAGSVVAKDTEVTLFSVKDDELEQG